MQLMSNTITSQQWNDAQAIYCFLSDVPPVPAHADLILAAGTYDLRVADHAAELFLAGHAPLLVCSGGFGKMTTRLFHRPEAEHFAERCVSLGVPESSIVVENRATNTGENFRFSRELLEQMGIKPKTGIVACKPYMARRTWATGTKQWPGVDWYPSPAKLSFSEYPTETITLEDSIQLMVGDLQRMRIYEEKGFQAHVDVPDEIWQAYERLVRGGFDEYVIHPQAETISAVNPGVHDA